MRNNQDENFPVREVRCEPFTDQRPGTAGLRKKVTVFQQPHYLETFVQAILDTVPFSAEPSLVIGGDGRYYNTEAINIIAALAAANGIKRLVIGQHGLLSTPAASNLIRVCRADGGVLLTASHNPGGPDGDFGIKFNTASGGQAPEQMTEAVYQRAKKIRGYRIAELASPDLSRCRQFQLGPMQVEVIDPVDAYAELMDQLFDFELIGNALQKGRIRLHFDALNAATGPYARRILCELLGAPANSVCNDTPLPDFGGLHPDPNPVDAAHLVKLAMSPDAPDLIAASDGDGDRNMILGRGMLVSPGDSLAIMLANTAVAPGYRNAVPGVARSMPTSRAVDLVASQLGITLYETPTGWRYFCNLLESNQITLCGEESFGTSSSHAREKDGLWAVLFWLNMMAALEQPVDVIVQRHWQRFGRCFFQRQDYFIPDAEQARDLLENLYSNAATFAGAVTSVSAANIFSYVDPVDGSVSEKQGCRVFLDDGSRIVYRLSGTGTSGATLRVYLDKPERNADLMNQTPAEALSRAARMAAELARIEEFTGLTSPTAII